MSFPVPDNEAARVAALRGYGILDSAPELAYDDVGELAAQICGCPISYVGFMDDDRLWLKAKYGLPPDFHQCPREIAFCTATVCGVDMVHAPDVTKDPRFNRLPFVVGEPHFRFYCGVPLITPEGYALGTLCVMDFQTRELTIEQQDALRRLAHLLVTQLEMRRQLVGLDQTLRELDKARQDIGAEKARAEGLLANILPQPIAEELKRNGKVEPRYFPSAAILFADFKDFSLFAERWEPAAVIGLLDQYYSSFDAAVARHGLQKLKTVGDAYIAVAGLPEPKRLDEIDACLAALEIRHGVALIRAQREKLRLPTLELRIGIHAGPVIAGVVGRQRFTYDVWGDAVNAAALMEANGVPGRINVSGTVAGRVRTLFELEPRGEIAAKHERRLEMFFLNRIKPELSADAEGRLPNDRFAAERSRLLTGYAGPG
jgi:adenylate cyclase